MRSAVTGRPYAPSTSPLSEDTFYTNVNQTVWRSLSTPSPLPTPASGFVYSDDRGNWYRPPRSPRQMAADASPPQPPSSSSTSFYYFPREENSKTTTGRSEHEAPSSFKAVEAESALPSSTPAYRNNSGTAPLPSQRAAASPHRTGGGDPVGEQCWACGVPHSLSTALLPSLLYTTPSEATRKRSPLSTVRLCEVCVKAFRLALQTDPSESFPTEELVARCRPTAVLRDGSRRFFHALREYILLQCLVGERVRRAARRATFLTNTSSSSPSSSPGLTEENTVLFDMPYGVQGKVLWQLTNILEQMIDVDTLQGAKGVSSNHHSQEPQRGRLTTRERYLLLRELHFLEKVSLSIEREEENRQRKRREEEEEERLLAGEKAFTGRADSEDPYKIVSTDFLPDRKVEPENPRDPTTLGELEHYLSSGSLPPKTASSAGAAASSLSKDKEAFYRITERTLREAFPTGSPFQRPPSMGSTGMVYSPSPARAVSEGAVPTTTTTTTTAPTKEGLASTNILLDYYGSSLALVKEREKEYHRLLIEQLHSQNMLTPHLTLDHAVERQERELYLLDHYLTTHTEKTDDRGALEKALHPSSEEDTKEANALIPALYQLKEEKERRRSAEAALQSTFQKVNALEKVNADYSRSLLHTNLSFTFTAHIEGMNQYYELVQAQLEEAVILKTMWFTEAVSREARLAQRDRAKAPFYASMAALRARLEDVQEREDTRYWGAPSSRSVNGRRGGEGDENEEEVAIDITNRKPNQTLPRQSRKDRHPTLREEAVVLKTAEELLQEGVDEEE